MPAAIKNGTLLVGFARGEKIVRGNQAVAGVLDFHDFLFGDPGAAQEVRQGFDQRPTGNAAAALDITQPGPAEADASSHAAQIQSGRRAGSPQQRSEIFFNVLSRCRHTL